MGEGLSRQVRGGTRDDLVVVLGRPTQRRDSAVMLARILPSGEFELLTAAAWSRALGYAPEELDGKSLRALMHLEAPVAQEAPVVPDVVGALLDRRGIQPLDVTLRCKDERRKRFRLHRRFDSYGEQVFVMADELMAASPPA